MRTPGAANQRAMSAVSSTSAPPSGAGAGRTAWAPAANRVDHGHRRHPASGGAGRSELAVADDGEVVAALTIRCGGDQLGQRGQCAQTLPAPQGLDGGGGAVAQSRGALVVVQLGQRE